MKSIGHQVEKKAFVTQNFAPLHDLQESQTNVREEDHWLDD